MLRPAVVSAIIDGFFEQLVPANVEARLDAQAKAAGARHEDSEPHAAVEQGGDNLPSIIARRAERQKERNALIAEMSSAESLHQIQLDRAAIEAKVLKALSDWPGLLSGSVA